ncbi:diaminobutyrate--2-oxoglutarate transaminase [Vibrio ruber]|uniref:Diaminobutyrate--2-oxoglutarate transaminase n=1 Tax=Vibrio ruber (strain DSM 16370 / JCM 11486 / BCRC 17186 / CECT 7878 / LMG 23124 / VR1) TaxID=1123498 RepID=A0A1R4LTS6_VIBR1|nr:diaminobutyrate--2-oxoglutarate transaminase [Vibrio ruber]WNJ97871.1 diaminobutyrate--2-oxoglutarate transaminase [Vibrio ruber]SJN59990.1 Diaminobutyrate--2-oxoglutarate transaminase [Vibrio ruber DSM 16370]
MNIFNEKESNVQSYANHFPVVFATAKGSCLYSERGDRYLDFLSGAGALNYGHNNAILKQALLDYIDRDGVTHGLDMYSQAKAEFLQAFEHHILRPRMLDYKLQFTGPTGTNAVEAALKLARKVTGRSNVIAFTNGFHGCSYGALAATGNQHHRGAAGLHLHGIQRLPYDGYAGQDGLKLFETMLTDGSSGMDHPAAVLVETVQGEGGLNVASESWLQRLNSLCKRHKILLIVDDIQAGCGRTGTFFSFEPAGITPDIVTLSKSIGGYGLPMSLVLMKPELDVWESGEHNGTFRGNNHAFVTATKAIETYWTNHDLEHHIGECAQEVTNVVEKMIRRYPELLSRRKGRGLMQGVECISGEVAEKIARECFNQGMIIETAGPDDEVLKFFCPLTISSDELKEGLDIFERATETVAPQYIKKAS